MSAHRHSCTPKAHAGQAVFDFQSPEPPAASVPAAATLADVVARLEADLELSRRRRRDLISAVRTLGRLAGTPLAEMPVSPASLRQVFEATSRASAGLSEGRWANMRSLVPAALRHAGVRTMARRTRKPLAPEWQDLREKLPTIKRHQKTIHWRH